MSGRYAEFVESEVLPLVEAKCHVKLTKDPEGRATMGGSSGGAAAIRQTANLSQSEVAAAVGVSRAAVSRWEAGTRMPRGEAARRYARLLEVLNKQVVALFIW